jgi:hypothetical protein
VGDFGKLATLGPVLEGVTRALLISHHDVRQVELQGNFVEAARRAGPVHVVKLSGLATAPDSPSRSGRWHAETEAQIRAAGLPWTFLHPPYFMQNLLRAAPAITAHGVLTAAMKDGRVAMVDARDVAAVAVAALTAPGHVGQTYVITGPRRCPTQGSRRSCPRRWAGRSATGTSRSMPSARSSSPAAPRVGSSTCAWSSRPSCARISRPPRPIRFCARQGGRRAPSPRSRPSTPPDSASPHLNSPGPEAHRGPRGRTGGTCEFRPPRRGINVARLEDEERRVRES